jgi:hypothetical protein
MSGKQFMVAVGAGFVAGIIVYLYDVTIGPMLTQTLTSVTGSVTGGNK